MIEAGGGGLLPNVPLTCLSIRRGIFRKAHSKPTSFEYFYSVHVYFSIY